MWGLGLRSLEFRSVGFGLKGLGALVSRFTAQGFLLSCQHVGLGRHCILIPEVRTVNSKS